MTVPHHALDITLTRPLTPAELHQATRVMPLAANHDATHLLALVHAKTPDKALNRLRHQTGGRLPIDVITTHYPDPDGKTLLNFAFPPATHAAADEAGQPVPVLLQLVLHRAIARHRGEEANRLGQAVQHLLAHTTASHLLSAVGRALTHAPGAARC